MCLVSLVPNLFLHITPLNFLPESYMFSSVFFYFQHFYNMVFGYIVINYRTIYAREAYLLLLNIALFLLSQILDVNNIPMVCAKRVRPLGQQAPNESRRLWLDVSVALARGDVETATSHKRALEEQQRKDERERAACNITFPTRLFSSPAPDHWVYNHLPPYTFVTCPIPSQSQ